MRRRAANAYETASIHTTEAQRKKEQMRRWEYVTTPLIVHNTAAILNNWGSEGWELVQVVTGPEGGLVAYLKRPLGEDD